MIVADLVGDVYQGLADQRGRQASLLLLLLLELAVMQALTGGCVIDHLTPSANFLGVQSAVSQKMVKL